MASDDNCCFVESLQVIYRVNSLSFKVGYHLRIVDQVSQSKYFPGFLLPCFSCNIQGSSDSVTQS